MGLGAQRLWRAADACVTQAGAPSRAELLGFSGRSHGQGSLRWAFRTGTQEAAWQTSNRIQLYV